LVVVRGAFVRAPHLGKMLAQDHAGLGTAHKRQQPEEGDAEAQEFHVKLTTPRFG